MARLPVYVYYGDELGRYGFPADHPFGQDRQGAFWNEILRLNLDAFFSVCSPVLATEEEIERFHTQAYVQYVKDLSAKGFGFFDQGDTPAFPGIFEAACHVVGSALDGVRALLAGECRRAFVPIAGLHHASRDQTHGFCIFNDAGVIIETLRLVWGIRSIAYVDIDAHHGDGVFYAFEEDANLFFADIHQDGQTIFPGTGDRAETGRGQAVGTKLNIPLQPGAKNQDFYQAWEEVEGFLADKPLEFIIFQCGADSIAGDPLTHLQWTSQAHQHAAKRLCQLADEKARGRIIALGGGGYNRQNIAHAWSDVVQAMIES